MDIVVQVTSDIESVQIGSSSCDWILWHSRSFSWRNFICYCQH